MKKTRILNLLSLTCCIVLIAAMALVTIGCNDNTQKEPTSSVVTDSVQNTEIISVGKGDTQFDFIVQGKDGNQTKFKVATNKKTVGEALIDAKLISGEDGDYGLYVKTVNNITLDFNVDGMYWAFYINDGYAISGVDTTEIKSGEVYSFKAEK